MKTGVTKTDPAVRVLLGILVGLVLITAMSMRAAFGSEAPGQNLTLTRLYRAAGTGQLLEATILEHDARVVGRFCPSGPLGVREAGVPDAESCREPIADFHTEYPRSEAATESMVDRLGTRTPVEIDRQGAKQLGRQLLTFVLPPLLVATLLALAFISRASTTSLLEAAGLGRFHRRRPRQQAVEHAVTLADVAGAPMPSGRWRR